MKTVVSAGRFLLHKCGLLRFLEMNYAGGAGILMYHNFDEARKSEYKRQFEYLAGHYRVRPLAEIAQAIRRGSSLPERTVAVTVDDGYEDFSRVAYPLVKACGIPVTVFLYTDFLDGKAWPWWDKVDYLCRNTALDRATVPLPAGVEVHLRLSGGPARGESALTLQRAMKELPVSELSGVLSRLEEKLRVHLPRLAPGDAAPLTWGEVRALAAEGVDFGAHGASHTILSRLRSAPEIRREVEASAERIQEELGARPEHFCYPNGRYEDIGPLARSVVERSGFRCAVTSEAGFNRGCPDPLMLERIGIDPWFPYSLFRERLAGTGVLRKQLENVFPRLFPRARAPVSAYTGCSTDAEWTFSDSGSGVF